MKLSAFFYRTNQSDARSRQPRSTTPLRSIVVSFTFLATVISAPLVLRVVRADNAPQTLPFSQNWTNTGLITTDDTWSAVAGIEGYLGQNITTATGTDPRTLLGTSSVAGDLDVIANQNAPNTLATGGIGEFDGIANPTIALNGSGTADAPYILLYLNTVGKSGITVSYNLRDLDGSVDNAIMPVTMQYRIGNSGNFANVSGGFVADATTGPSLATLVTPVSAILPAAADNNPLVQVRVMTTNAVGNDEWVGVDDIAVTGSGTALPTNPAGTGQAAPGVIVAGASTLLTVNVTPGTNPTSTGLTVSADLSSIDGSATQTFFDNGTNGDVTSGDNIFSYNAATLVTTSAGSKTLPFAINDAESRSGSGSISLTVQAPPPLSDHVVISQVYGGGGLVGATYLNDYVELYNPSSTTFNLNGWSVQYASSGGSFGPGTLTPLAGPIAPGEYYLVKLASGGGVGLPLPQANVEGTTNMSASTGKVALVNNSDPLTDGSSPCTLTDPNLVDFVGFGTANCREGTTNAPAGGNSAAVTRNGGGAVDTNQNSADFTAVFPNPRRTAIILDSAPSVSSTDTDSDAFASTPAPRDASVAVFFSEPVEVTGTWYDLTCASSGPHTAVVAAGPRNWVITPDVNFQPGEQCTFQIFAANVKDTDTDDSQPNTDFLQANYSTTFTVATGPAAPYDPSVHLTMGNPNGAISSLGQPNNYLLEKREYSLSYNRDRGGPNWVSWHLSDDWTGSLTRVDTFRPDPSLPATWNRVNQFDYTGSGFDRGHMVPSADRLATLPINQSTFLMDNIIPQAPDNNQNTWNNMEQALRTYTPANELYIVAGGAGTGGSGDVGPASTIAGGRIAVPAFTWKVALVIPKGENDISRVSCSSRTIAVIVPNTNGTNPDWTNYLTTVDAVENLTGYDFFSNLPEPIQRCTEAGINGNNPPLDTDADGVPDSTDNCDFVANAGQDNYDNDSEGDACDADDDNDGFSDSIEAAEGSDPRNAASTPEICDGIDNDLNDGADEGFANTDGDGQANCVDADDDNDGVSDTAEIASGSDPLNSGSTPEVCDGLDNDLNEGIDEGFADTDNDNISDCVDPDDDNDGQSDADEISCGSNPSSGSNTSPDNDGDNRPDCVDPDDDNDGVSDTADNCRFIPNAGQTDSDADGLGDACDADDDNDGVSDATDNCRVTSNPNQSDYDADGIGDACDADDDNDGVLDVTDNCDFTPNPDQRDTNADGIGDLCTAFENPSGGQFVIGDLVPLTNGASVNFWGPQWATNNPMSGGAAPRAFKGFENSPGLPACGTTWSSQPGNSSNSPATVPRFMPVIVSGTVGKNGSGITGNVSRVVIVETNPGYGPSPGQAGTGRIIAILCSTP